jgi:hypothetical protein
MSAKEQRVNSKNRRTKITFAVRKISQGLSYYSDKTAARLLCISQEQLRHARLGLLQAGLIAYEAPLYQVLSLEPILSSEQPAPRTGQTLPIGAILRQMMESSGRPPQP